MLRAKVAELEQRVLTVEGLERQNAELKVACERLEGELRREKQAGEALKAASVEPATGTGLVSLSCMY